MKNEEFWKGLVEVRQREDIKYLGDVPGGFVNVVSYAKTSQDFRRKVSRALDELGLDLVDLDDIQILSQEIAVETASEEILTMIDTVRRLDSVAFGTFFVYDEENDSGQ